MSDKAAHKRTFAAGDWYAVVGEDVTVLVPPGARSRVAELWDIADRGGSFDAVLDGLLAGGLSSLEGFALVGHGERTRVLVRGDVAATFSTAHGEVAMAHEADSMWADRTLDGVTGGRITVGDAVLEADLALVAGVARAGAVQFGERALGADGAQTLEPAHVAPLHEPEPTDEEAPESAPWPAQVAEPAPVQPDPEPAPAQPDPEPAPAQPDPEPAPAPAPAQPDPEPAPAPAPDPAPATERVDSEPLSFGSPLADDPATTGEQPAVVDASPYTAPDHDGQTTVGTPVEDFARPVAGVPGQELAPSVVAHPVAKLMVSTGEVIDVDRVILFGRAPEARAFASSDQPRLVTVASPHHEISSTHLEIRPGAGADHGMAVVTDMGSTNGTVLVQPGLPPEDLQAGMAVALIPGAILDLGDGVTIQTTNP
ncbi:FHA domain-containing protein [Nocardioides sp.]|uniref:FHA domain-containing protein n=1 Tax=Nocardioides sp. TaxID=35761 RepID=UPI002CD81478|nr:FHA domain-containing protein [Nocardioides sp.]HXH78911.1 FHA domain-containing protein [Nocardioides sp.]